MYEKSLKLYLFCWKSGEIKQRSPSCTKTYCFGGPGKPAAVGFPGLPGRKTCKFLHSGTSYFSNTYFPVYFPFLYVIPIALCCRYLQGLLECVCKGISDPSAQVRNAALFALGQFSEHLQVGSHTKLFMRLPKHGGKGENSNVNKS